VATFGRARRGQAGGSTFARPFALLFLASLALLLLRDTTAVRSAASLATEALVPAERVLGQLGASAGRVWQAVAEIETLRADKEALQAQVDRLTLENIHLREQAFLAEQAAELAVTAKELPFKTVSAQVIARDPSGEVHTILLGAGARDGVFLDDIVISSQGVVGRVFEVGQTYSKVLLVTDTGSVVSALVQDSRAAGIVRGQFGDTLVMDWILETENVKPGDAVITAGLAIGIDLRSLYPKGLILGKVADVTKGEGAFQRAIVVPAVDLRHLENVLVVRITP
jgi:rod shape-determining protein MreC